MVETRTQSGDRRASAEALLELAASEGRGKLKVFLGMAPGVGKTYAMLSAARELKSEGVDVVVGLVETHGRAETAALLDNLEILARRPVAYRNRALMEFDVDAAIARRPQLLLVDEFAHTNAPGLVHPKRYQDVEGILQAGINVWTTLNIQHLESLRDVVARITGVSIQETVPDKVIARADDVVVIDLPPEDLIQRLKDGKVYVPENARRAIDQFFKASNLTALRELALRRTADRVDEQMLAQLRQQGVEGPWPTAERLLVCVGGDELSEAVVRVAGRMAQASKSDWIAVHFKATEREDTDRGLLKRTDRALRLAEQLGATTVRLNVKDAAGDLLAYAKRNNITQIVVGRPRKSPFALVFQGSLAGRLIAGGGDISVTVIGGENEKNAPPMRLKSMRPRIGLTTIGSAVVAVGVAVALGTALDRVTSLPNLSMIFLLAVLMCAFRFGLWSAVVAAALSFLAYNFFFIEPRYTLTIAQPHELLSLLIFLVTAVVTGGLAGRLKENAVATGERAEATQALYDFARKLSGAADIDSVLWLLAAQSAATVRGQSIVLLKDNDGLAIRGGWPPEDDLSTSDWAAARWAHQKGELAGRFTETLPTAKFQFRPLISTKGSLGVVGISPADEEDHLASATDSAVQSFIDQAAIAVERTMLVDRAAKLESAAESERLRVAVLSSVSHDLKTPLASIVGSASSLRQLGDKMSDKDRFDLLVTIEEESVRLSRFVSNLLDMMKIEAGALDIRRDIVKVDEAIGSAVDRARKSYPKRRIEVSVEPKLPSVPGDGLLLQQVIFNLLDNAHKYSPPASVTRVEARGAGSNVSISVDDDGAGIPRGDLERVFEKFYRVTKGDGRAPGTGLGLAIAAGLVKGMRGSITAESPLANGRGTRMHIILPGANDAGTTIRDPGANDES